MADCEFLKGRPFFNDMSVESGLGAMYKKKSCQSDNTKCARYMVVQALGREKVPINLYPNMVDRANQIISEG